MNLVAGAKGIWNVAPSRTLPIHLPFSVSLVLHSYPDFSPELAHHMLHLNVFWFTGIAIEELSCRLQIWEPSWQGPRAEVPLCQVIILQTLSHSDPPSGPVSWSHYIYPWVKNLHETISWLPFLVESTTLNFIKLPNGKRRICELLSPVGSVPELFNFLKKNSRTDLVSKFITERMKPRKFQNFFAKTELRKW